jgi:hypothetical protein
MSDKDLQQLNDILNEICDNMLLDINESLQKYMKLVNKEEYEEGFQDGVLWVNRYIERALRDTKSKYEKRRRLNE